MCAQKKRIWTKENLGSGDSTFLPSDIEHMGAQRRGPYQGSRYVKKDLFPLSFYDTLAPGETKVPRGKNTPRVFFVHTQKKGCHRDASSAEPVSHAWPTKQCVPDHRNKSHAVNSQIMIMAFTYRERGLVLVGCLRRKQMMRIMDRCSGLGSTRV